MAKAEAAFGISSIETLSSEVSASTGVLRGRERVEIIDELALVEKSWREEHRYGRNKITRGKGGIGSPDALGAVDRFSAIDGRFSPLKSRLNILNKTH